jgi:5-methylcytosine-specific restriction endonuclease McrA
MAKKAKKKRVWVLQAMVFSVLRRAFRMYPPYKETLDDAKEEYYVDSKKGKKMRRVRFKCAKCSKKYARTNIAVDHIIPVVDFTGVAKQEDDTPDFNIYIKRLYCARKNLQILCLPCHKAKTKDEGKQRTASKTTTKPTRKGSK